MEEKRKIYSKDAIVSDRRSLRAVVIITSTTVFFLSLISLCVGRYNISLSQVMEVIVPKCFIPDVKIDDVTYNVIINLRLPRIIVAILIGGALSLSGITFQGIFKNPLVSPDILGVSSGACVGAAIAILLGQNIYGIQILAFIFGIVTVAITMLIPRIMKRDSTIMLVLSGVIVSGFMSSVLGFIKYIANPETQLADITYWQLGSIAKVTYGSLLKTAPIIIIAASILICLRWRINILSLGDNEARSLGVNLRIEKGLAVLCATILTASSVCISGTIGWIGLVMPHLARMVVGNNNVRCLPVATIMSGGFLLIIDTLARTISVGEIPLGILTGLIGTPFFAWMLIKQKMES
ncbi:iron ABC transporter permease [Clostridium sp. SHJSY1]|uniref:FecCD family ABC transporter permease n=1 Tax=Clostridium sp. SHJSY1 TaxID=2942483 RepID=UPI0028749495|nr:iron ABC transporter permease [Clostridium sp. SHJSY1]MDS0525807.1 iron ABC transporter permease [Clostridium sp. SHJSY1]